MRRRRRFFVYMLTVALIWSGALMVRGAVNFWVVWLLLMFVALANR